MVLNRSQLSRNWLGFVSLQPQINHKVGHIPEQHAAIGQAASLVVFPTGCAMVSRLPYYQPSSLQVFTRYPVMVDVDKHACHTLTRRDSAMVCGQKVMSPGISWTNILRPWNPGTFSLTGITYPGCIFARSICEP